MVIVRKLRKCIGAKFVTFWTEKSWYQVNSQREFDLGWTRLGELEYKLDEIEIKARENA